MIYQICQGESIEYIAIKNNNDGLFYVFLADDIGDYMTAVTSGCDVYKLAHKFSSEDSDPSVGLNYCYSVFELR